MKNLIEEMEEELRRPPRYGPGKRRRVNWPVKRIAALIEYVKAAEELFLHGQMPLRFSRDVRLQAARKKLGLVED